MKRFREIAPVAACVLLVAFGVASAQHAKSVKTPLDELKAAEIPAAERFPWQPKGLVAVYGSHAWHYWRGLYMLHLTTNAKEVTARTWNASPGHAEPGDTLRIFDAATSKDLAVFKLPKDQLANGAGFSQTGKLVALCQENEFDWTATVWDAASKKVQYRVSGKGASPGVISFSPNGKLLAYEAGGIQFFDLASGKHLFTSPRSYSWWLFHPNSTRVYYETAPLDEKTSTRTALLFEFDLIKRKERLLLTRPGFYPDGLRNNLAIAPDGRWLATTLYPNDPAARSHVQLWNVIEDKPGAKIDCGGVGVSAMAFSPDNKTLAIVVGPYGKIQFHERGSGKLIRTLDAGVGGLHNLTFSPDGKFLAAASENASQILHWDLASDKPLHEITASARIVAVSPDSRSLLVEAKYGPAPGLALVDLPTGRRLPIEPVKGQNTVWAGAFSPDGRTLALGVHLGAAHMRIIDTQTGKDTNESQPAWGTGEHQIAFFLPEGKKLLTAGGTTCSVWDLTTRKAETRKYAWTFVSAALSHDGKTLIADTSENIKIIDLANLEVIKSLDREGRPGLVAVSRDGKKVAQVSYFGTAVKVLNMTDGETLYDFKGHIQPISAVCFDRKSEDLFTAGWDGRIIRWLSATSKQEWRVPGAVLSMHLSPEGRHLMLNNANGTAYVVRVEELE